LSKEIALKVAQRSARLDEREHYSKIVDKYKRKAEVLSSKVVSLTSRTVSAELQRKVAEAQVNRSTRRADDVMAQNALQEQRIKELEAALKQQQSQLMELEEELDKKNDELHELDKSFSIKVFGKVRGGQRGATSWPHFVWELIMEQLVNGTPPTSVNANILSFV